MTTLFENTPRDAGGAGEDGGAARRAFRARTTAAWFDPRGTGESAFLCPGRPSAMGHDDESSRGAADGLERDADRRVIEAVRGRALGGDPHAQALTFRASRGVARPVDVTPLPCQTEALPSEVAAVMIEAGLTAIDALTRGQSDPLAI